VLQKFDKLYYLDVQRCITKNESVLSKVKLLETVVLALDDRNGYNQMDEGDWRKLAEMRDDIDFSLVRS